MKLAEALILRADLQKRIAQLGERLNNNAKVQEGDQPAESPKKLLAELDSNTEQLERLVTAINLTNAATAVSGETITALIARRDALTGKVGILRAFVSAASDKVTRYSNNEIKINSTVNVEQMQEQLDELSKTLRELETRLQGLNWTTELISK